MSTQSDTELPLLAFPQEPGFQKGSEASEAMAMKMKNKAKLMRKTIWTLAERAKDQGITTEEVSIFLQSYNSSVPARFRELELMGCLVRREESQRPNKDRTRMLDVYFSTGEGIPEGYQKPKVPTKYALGKRDAMLELMEWINKTDTLKGGWWLSSIQCGQEIVSHINKKMEA